MSDIEIQCPHCELIFDVPQSMHGGIASCPECKRTVPIKGGPEPLYWILVGLGVLAVLTIGGGVALVNPIAGIVITVIGLAIVGIVAVAA